MQTEKKIAQTDAIFSYVHSVNEIADQSDGVIRLSIDTKANVKVYDYSRGGYSRQSVKAADHDFNPEIVLKPFGIFLPAYNENYFYFTDGNVTADFMIDALHNLWPSLKARFNHHTIVINSDNGPENNGHRNQLMKRLIEFALKNQVSISLAYCPPYHSKSNPIERVWAVLENHWNGELLDSIEKVLGLARTMQYNGKNPVDKLVKGTYEKGIKLLQKARKRLEKMIIRITGIEKWAVDITCYVNT